MFIGKDRTSAHFFGGYIDEVRAWNVALTGTQIKNNKNVNIVPASSGLLAYYKINEGSGSTTADATNSHTLSLSGSPVWLTSLAPVGYTWAPGALNTPTITVSPTVTSTYTISLSVAGCTGTASKQITVSNHPASTITTANTSFCSGPTSSVGGNVSATGAWTLTLSNGATATGNGNGTFSKTVIPLIGTNIYTVSALTDASGCAANITGADTIKVNAHPTAAITGANVNVCKGSSANITGSVTATGAWTLTLSNGAKTTGTANGAFSIPVTPDSTTTYTISSLTDANCTSLSTGLTGIQVLTVKSRPTATVTSKNTKTCNTAVITGNVQGSGAWKVTLNNGSMATGNGNATFSITVNPIATTTYAIASLSDANCSAINTDLKGSTVDTAITLPTATLDSSLKTVCSGSTVSITGTVIGTGSWTLTLSNGGGTVTGVPFSSRFVTTVTPLTTSTYKVVSLTDSFCSAAPAGLKGSNSVIINPRPTATITGSTVTICNGSSANITGNVTAHGSWTLTLSDGTIISGYGNNSYSAAVSPSTTTTYTILSLADSLCTSFATDVSGSQTVNVRDRPTANISISGSNTCAGSSTNVTGTVTATGLWTLTLNNGASTSGNGSGSFNVSVNPTVTTTYSLSTLNDAYCTSYSSDLTGSIVVNTLTRPTASITGSGYGICKGAYASVTGMVTATGAWTLTLNNGGATATGNGSFTATVNPTVTATYTIQSLYDANCTSQTSDFSGNVSIAVNPINTWTGNLSTDWNTPGNWCGLVPTSTSDVYIPSSASRQPSITSASQCHNLTLGKGSVLTVSGASANLAINGNITDSGTISYTSGTLNLNGNATQTINASLQVYNLTINNSNGVIVKGYIAVGNVLTLSSGKIQADSIIVNNAGITAITGYQTNAQLSAFSASSYIVGALKRKVSATGRYDFPVGTSTNYELITFNLTNLLGTNSLMVQYGTTNTSCTTPIGDSIKINGTKVNTLLDGGIWTVTPDAEPVSGSYAAFINERGYNNYPGAASQMTLIKRADCSANWRGLGTHNNGTQYFAYNTAHAERTNLSTFSQFGIGWGDAPLPVILLNFKAILNNPSWVNVTWTTSNQFNNRLFEVQRSMDGVAFTTINTIDGCGVCHDVRKYNFADTDPISGISYYRLLMIDNTSTYTYSEIAPVVNTQLKSFSVTGMYPNPTSNLFNIGINSTYQTQVFVSINDITGKVLNVSNPDITVGTNNITLNTVSLQPGVYMINVSDNTTGTTKVLRFVKIN